MIKKSSKKGKKLNSEIFLTYQKHPLLPLVRNLNTYSEELSNLVSFECKCELHEEKQHVDSLEFNLILSSNIVVVFYMGDFRLSFTFYIQ